MSDKPLFPFLEGMKTELGAQKGAGIPFTIPGSPYLGEYVLVGPFDPPGKEKASPSYLDYNFTGAPGTATAIYYSLVYAMPKWGYNVVKVDENIDISPTHTEYYQMVMTQRQQLEGTIRAGLGEAAKAVADYELLKHDLRKYKEVLNYFAKKDEHSLKAMFIDQVDIHTGQMSMVQLAPRWPTLIADFQRLTDKDDTPEGINKKYDLSKAEAVVLTTKNKLYVQWKDMFKEAAIERYQRIKGLAESRKMSIDEYQKWVKPYIARYKAMKVSGERKGSRSEAFTSFADLTGQATFSNYITVWAWKPMKPFEHRRAPIEKTGKFAVDPEDPLVVGQFITSPKTGLAHPDHYPWLLNRAPNGKYEWRNIIDEVKDDWIHGRNQLDPKELYYFFFETVVQRYGARLKIGELEDITFTIRGMIMSQNVLLVKLVELKCREREVEKYIDEILGLRAEDKPIEEIVKTEFPELFGVEVKKETGIRAFIEQITAPFVHMKKGAKEAQKSAGKMRFRGLYKYGPYEREFKERLSKQYLKPLGAQVTKVAGLLQSKMGVI